MRCFVLLVVSWATACGWSEARFLVDGTAAICEAASACAGHHTPEECGEAIVRPDCDYDPSAARRCAAALEEAACVEVGTSTRIMELSLPEDCTQVYSCPWPELSFL